MKAIYGYLLALLVGAAFGYYAMPRKEITKTVEKQVDRVVTIITRPDGTKEEVTVDKSKITSEDNTKLNVGRSKLNLSALVGVQSSNLSSPVFGGHLSKEILGPISVGVWGLSSGAIGASMGLNF